MSISYEESEPSNRRDNDTEHKKFLAIRSKQSEDLGRVSYVEHVSESQGKNQYSAIQPCLEDALDQGRVLRAAIHHIPNAVAMAAMVFTNASSTVACLPATKD